MSRGLKRAWMIVGTLLVVSLIVLLLLTVFRIKTFTVVGNERYSADKIEYDLCDDFRSGNTLWFSWKYRTAASDPKAPYLNTIQAKIISPSEVRVIVQEKRLIGCVQYNGQYVSFDSDGIVLEIGDEAPEETVLVTGVTMDEPVLYQKLPVSNTAQMRTMLSICRLLGDSGLEPDAVDFDENGNITVTIGTVRVELGQDEYLEEKVSNLVTIYPKVASQTGTLNMTAFTGRYETVTFSANDGSDETAPGEEGADTVGETVDTAGSDTSGEEGSADTGEDTGEAGLEDAGSGEDSQAGTGEEAQPEDTGEETAEEGQVGLDAFMVFDSSGTLRYDAHVVNGQVVDAYGNPIDGCYVNENGNVMDAYWNEIDPHTGTLAE